MKYQKIKKYDVANGSGLRVSIWLTGCDIKCEGCFNKELWDAEKGIEFTEHTKDFLFKLLQDPHCSGLSVLGGEPTIHDKELSEFLKECKAEFPNKDIWLWTGYELHSLIQRKVECINYVDVLIDGPFISKLADKNLKFKGSSNQHIYRKQNNLWVINPSENDKT